MGLINGCGLYMDFYGRLVLKDVFLERETNVFALDRQKRFFVCETWSKHDNIEFLQRGFEFSGTYKHFLLWLIQSCCVQYPFLPMG